MINHIVASDRDAQTALFSLAVRGSKYIVRNTSCVLGWAGLQMITLVKEGGEKAMQRMTGAAAEHIGVQPRI